MTHRRNIKGADLHPRATQHVGMLNAEKCVIYLRGIGVEIDDATADSWLDIQATYRFLRSERSAWRSVRRHFCQCGSMIGYSEIGRGRMKIKRDGPQKPARCDECGSGWQGWSLVFVVRRDGTIQDYRKGVDAVIPLRLDEFAGGV